LTVLTACHQPTQWLIPDFKLSLDMRQKAKDSFEVRVFDSGRLLVSAVAQLPKTANGKRIRFRITDTAPLDQSMLDYFAGLTAQAVMVGFLKYRCGQTFDLYGQTSFGFRFAEYEHTSMVNFCTELQAFSGIRPVVGLPYEEGDMDRVTLWRGSLCELEALARFAVRLVMARGICREPKDLEDRYVNSYQLPEKVTVGQ
jgi:hypothetical protein